MSITNSVTTYPATDDGGKTLGKCISTSDTYVTYIPTGVQSACDAPPDDAPYDRAGNKIYGCVNMSGNQSTGCRSIALHGHPQDFNRKLYNDDVNIIPFGWEERGVELYENFGLSEQQFNGNGNYGLIGPDNIGIYSRCNRDTVTATGNHACQNRCITELGRKISLFGSVGFAYYTANTSQLPTTETGYRFANGFFQPTLPSGSSGFGYLFRFYGYNRTDTGDLYTYFGNSGATFKDAEGTQFYIIYGKTPFIVNSSGTKISVPSDQMNYYWASDDGTMVYIDIKFFNTSAVSPLGLNYGTNTASFSDSTNCTSDALRDSLDSPAVAFPFPGNWFSQLFCDVGFTTNGPSPYKNCYYSGVRSMYIPPHMRVDAFSTLLYRDNTKSWNSYSGTQYYDVGQYGQNPSVEFDSWDTAGVMDPFTYDMSPYTNGTFPSLAGSVPNSPFTGTSYNTTSYLTPAIHNCSLLSIWVNVRRDADFRNIYVNRWYNNAKLLPEILLIPGIQNSSTFMNNMMNATLNPNELQKIVNPQDFWSQTANPYHNGTVAQLNVSKQPYDVIPITTAANVTSMAIGLSNKLINALPMKIPKPLSTYYKRLKNNFAGHTNIQFTTTSGKPLGTGRITSFDYANGVYSLEWLYVIYTCAFSYAPTQTNGLIYDTTIQQYVCNNANTCRRECMLFRDPYYTSNKDNTSASDMFMKLYCFTKNVTVAYASYSNPSTNDCSCTASMSYCPGAFDNSCKPGLSTGQDIYIPDGTIDTTDTCEDTCSYCKSVNIQYNFQDGQVSNSKNNQIDQDGTCSDISATCITTSTSGGGGGGGGGGNGDSQATDSKTGMYVLFIIMMIIIIIVICIIGYAGYKKLHKGLNN